MLKVLGVKYFSLEHICKNLVMLLSLYLFIPHPGLNWFSQGELDPSQQL